MPRIVRQSIAILFLLSAIGLTAYMLHTTAPPQRRASDRLQVVAAENVWGAIATELGGSHVSVTSLSSDPVADPHLYESSAMDAQHIASADIVIINGLGYDDFASKLLSASSEKDRQVIVAAQEVGATAGANPHLWYDTTAVGTVAEAISAAYRQRDPAHANDYAARLSSFNKSLCALQSTITTAQAQYGHQAVLTTEPVADYLLDALSLDRLTPREFASSIEEGVEPRPADSAAMERMLATQAVVALVYNPQAATPTTERLRAVALQSDAPVISMTETMPPTYATYFAWQQAQLTNLLKTLQGSHD